MPISPELHALLDASLDSFEKLELVLVLRAAHRPLSIVELALELQVGHEALRRVLDEVIDAGLAARRDVDLVELSAGIWEPQLTEAAAAYRHDPAVLRAACTAITMAKLRERAARTFTEAALPRAKDD